MKAGVVSDTHGNADNLREAVEWLSAAGADLIIHLGDDASDMNDIVNPGLEVISVPGVFEEAYGDEKIPNRILKEFCGARVLITHTPRSHEKDLPGDIKPGDVIEKGGTDLVLHGHTHAAGIRKKGASVIINPGHLKPPCGRGGEPSFALVDFQARRAEIISLGDKAVVMRGVF